MNVRHLLSLIVANLALISPAFACDPCALFNATRLRGHSEESFTLAISEQYTDFDRAKDAEDNSVRNGELVKGFSTTQLTASYDLSDKFGIQANIPFLARRYDDVERFRTSEESDAGFGDLSLIGAYSFVDYKRAEWSVLAGVFGGVKFPTGDTGVLEEFVAEDGSSREGLVPMLAHHQVSSASGGRALVFGTGSFDYIMGLNLLTRYQRYVATGSVQYTIRTEGDYSYKFANELLASVGSGYYFYLEHEYSAAALLVLYGEFKGRDDQSGDLVVGSQVSNLFLGPELMVTLSENLSLATGVSFRITGEDVDATVVPDTRITASLSYRFS